MIMILKKVIYAIPYCLENQEVYVACRNGTQRS